MCGGSVHLCLPLPPDSARPPQNLRTVLPAKKSRRIRLVGPVQARLSKLHRRRPATTMGELLGGALRIASVPSQPPRPPRAVEVVGGEERQRVGVVTEWLG